MAIWESFLGIYRSQSGVLLRLCRMDDDNNVEDWVSMLRLTAICFVAFGFIASIYSVLPMLLGPLGTELSFAIAFVVEFMALFSVAIGLVIYDTTKRQQLLYVALGMFALFVGDGVSLAAPVILRHLEPGWLSALLSHVAWFGLLSRVVANSFFLISVLRANSCDNICRNDHIWGATPLIIASIFVVLLVLSWVSPLFTYDVSHVFSYVIILPLLLSAALSVITLSGYLQRMAQRPTAFEVMLTAFFLNSVYHHMAFVFFDSDGRAITAEFLMPSRLFSYGLVLVAMVASLRDLYRNASQSSSAKSAFLATMSHEIRTPLNGVLGMAQLLRQTSLNGVQRERVDAILSSGRALMSLLNDILDMSKIEAGHAEIETRPFRPYDITCDLSNAIVALTQEKNLKLVWDDKVLRNKIFIGDEIRFRQVLWNLLSNAVKFTHKGSVQLVVENDPSRAGGRVTGSRLSEVYRFSVSDTGIGIAPERQARIFQAFTQGDNSTMRQFGGTGLGLSISQNLIKMMGGHIGLHSVPGQGTRFDCWLPFDVRSFSVSEPDSAMIDREENTLGVLAGKRVLVVEDNEINANVMLAFLERLGLKVDIVGNGRLAVQSFQNNDYDAILMDAHMPILDGEGATRHIREIERGTSGGRVPIIGVTADVFAERQRDFLAAGMDEVLTKPVEERKLRASLIHHLSGRVHLAATAEAGPSEAEMVESRPDFTDETPNFVADYGSGSGATTKDLSWSAFANPALVNNSISDNDEPAGWHPAGGARGRLSVGPVQYFTTHMDVLRSGHPVKRQNIPDDSPSPGREKRISTGTNIPKENPEHIPTSDHPPFVRRVMGRGALKRRFTTDPSPNQKTKDTIGNAKEDPHQGPVQGAQTDTSPAHKAESGRDELLVSILRLKEMQDALGTAQLTALIRMLPDAYRDERDRMTEAAKTDDISGFRRAAHSLKGMAANLAADELSHRARSLEYFSGDLRDALKNIDDLDDVMNRTYEELLGRMIK